MRAETTDVNLLVTLSRAHTNCHYMLNKPPDKQLPGKITPTTQFFIHSLSIKCHFVLLLMEDLKKRLSITEVNLCNPVLLFSPSQVVLVCPRLEYAECSD